jgi:hypothetical protein
VLVAIIVPVAQTKGIKGIIVPIVVLVAIVVPVALTKTIEGIVVPIVPTGIVGILETIVDMEVPVLFTGIVGIPFPVVSNAVVFFPALSVVLVSSNAVVPVVRALPKL